MTSRSCLLNHRNLPLRLSRIHRLSLPSSSSSSLVYSSSSRLDCAIVKLQSSVIQQYSSCVRRNVSTGAFDDDSFDFPLLDDWSPEESTSYASSSDGEDFDGDIFLTPVHDVDLPSASASNKDALTVAAHRLVTIGRGHKNHRQVAVGGCFSFWLDIASISSPYGMKTLLPLPLGLVYLGRYYQLLTSCCFVSMGHGVKLADALDGLAGGIAALAFIGMSIAVLPICSELAIFGASMAGSCVGFLLHNRYKASVFMGKTGSLALGGALTAMAACTGMFFPLLISSGIFIVESSLVILQVLYLKITRGFLRGSWHFLRMPPFYRRLHLLRFREPNIVLGAYSLRPGLIDLLWFFTQIKKSV